MLKKIAIVFTVLLLVIQFFRPNQENPPVNPAYDFQQIANPPSEVLLLLKGACYDCHSHETKYPWYSQLAPISWVLSNHIVEGREHLNFSDFGNLPMGEQAELLGEAAEAIQEHEMPMSSYTWMGLHPEANLSQDQRDVLINWLSANGREGQGDEQD